MMAQLKWTLSCARCVVLALLLAMTNTPSVLAEEVDTDPIRFTCPPICVHFETLEEASRNVETFYDTYGQLVGPKTRPDVALENLNALKAQQDETGAWGLAADAAADGVKAIDQSLEAIEDAGAAVEATDEARDSLILMRRTLAPLADF